MPIANVLYVEIGVKGVIVDLILEVKRLSDFSSSHDTRMLNQPKKVFSAQFSLIAPQKNPDLLTKSCQFIPKYLLLKNLSCLVSV